MATNPWHRNLERDALGGVILDCSNDNMKKVLSSQVFGLPKERFVYVKNIKKGLLLFLFNTDDRKLRGVYLAASKGENRPALDEWTGRQYPARVQICASRDYPLATLAEDQFKYIIAGNYYSEKDFRFELDHDQATKLMSLFFSLGMPVLYRQLLGQIEELKAFKQEHTLNMGPDKELSILILGGYEEDNCSSVLHCFSPSENVLRSHGTMPIARPYASVARIDRELYVMGGCSGSQASSRVESFNSEQENWTTIASLKEPRSEFAAAVLDGKLFAVGGSTGSGCLSSVEMFKPKDEKWTSASRMLEKRSHFGAVEFDGAIYAVGGFDGKSCLESAERYDPRVDSWRKIGSMGIKRCGHSLVVLNGKLYAIGGFDGLTEESNAVTSVEMYDPRLEMWMDVPPMNHIRGDLVAGVMNDSIYVIGGVKNPKNQAVNSIECYKEGQGWEETNFDGKLLIESTTGATGIVLEEEFILKLR